MNAQDDQVAKQNKATKRKRDEIRIPMRIVRESIKVFPYFIIIDYSYNLRSSSSWIGGCRACIEIQNYFTIY